MAVTWYRYISLIVACTGGNEVMVGAWSAALFTVRLYACVAVPPWPSVTLRLTVNVRRSLLVGDQVMSPVVLFRFMALVGGGVTLVRV